MESSAVVGYCNVQWSADCLATEHQYVMLSVSVAFDTDFIFVMMLKAEVREWRYCEYW